MNQSTFRVRSSARLRKCGPLRKLRSTNFALAKFTTRLFSVRAASWPAPFFASLITSTRCSVPTIAREIASAWSRIRACNVCSHAFFVVSGISSYQTSCRCSRAGTVYEAKRGIEPNLVDQVHSLLKLHFSFAGKPTMKSEDKLMFGRTSRSLRMRSR